MKSRIYIRCVTLLFVITFSTINFLYSQTFHPDYQDGLIVFQLKQGVKPIVSKDKKVDFRNENLFSDFIMEYNIEEVKQLHPDIKDSLLNRTYQIKLSDMFKVDELIKKLQNIPTIEYAELKELHYSSYTPNDTYFSQQNQWSLFMVQAEQAWDISIGNSNVIVAVTDNAIETSHQDLQNAMLPGYDATNGSNNPSPCGTNDGAHGTHVSGTVGAETDNGMGVSSIGFGVSILPVKIGNCSGQLTHGYEGIIWAADNDADIINMSWGGPGSSQYGQNVINYAWNKGAIPVAAAGNDNVSSKFYPAAYSNVVTVASTNQNDTKSNFSNYGDWIDIASPGSQIASTVPGNAYSYMSGTSMASPMVSGQLGLMKSYAPSATNQNLINCLYNSSDPLPSDNHYLNGQLGAGRINAFNALNCMSSFVIALDASISKILSPQGSICSSSIQPQVELRNYGSSTLTSATITYNWGGNAYIYNWTGNLPTGQATTVNLPNHNLQDGIYTFTATVSSPNGQTDGNPANNTATQNFSISSNGVIVTLNVDTDCWGSETTWEITNSNNVIIASGGPYVNVSGGTSNSHQICLSSGCFTFTIYDAHGDGMHGSQYTGSCSVDGYYELLNFDGSTLFTMTAPNADFGNSTSHQFCINNNTDDAGIESIESPAISCSPNINPVVRLKNFGLDPLTSVTIRYQITGGAWQNYSWTGNLTTNQTQLVTLPAITLNGGSQVLIVETSMPNGVGDQEPNNDQAQTILYYQNTSYPLPFVEDFESSISGKWVIENPDNDITWERATVSGTTPGSNAMKLDFFNYGQVGRRDGLISPKINLSFVSDASMYFEHAFRRYNQNAADSLIIYVSTDCGATWNRVFGQAENGSGNFATQTTNTIPFTPANSSDWCLTGSVGASCFTINLNQYVGNEILIKFESYNAASIGNNLFVDNINITGTPSGSAPTPDYAVNVNQICAGDTVNFTDMSTDIPTSWNWTFPGGSPATSNTQNPTVVYPSSGIYNVTLEVSNPFGSQIANYTNVIIVNDNPQISVTSSDTAICVGDGVTLTASGANNYSWNNGLGTGYLQNVYPSVTTTYTVTATENGCSDTDSIQVAVNPLPATPTITQTVNTLSVNLQPGETAEWFLNGSSVGTGTQIVIFESGYYEVVVTNENGCSSSIVEKFDVQTSQLIKDNLENSLSINPNPTENIVNISWGGADYLSSIKIYDMQGRMIYQLESIDNNKQKIDLSPFDKGVYIVKINIGDKTFSKKIIKR